MLSGLLGSIGARDSDRHEGYAAHMDWVANGGDALQHGRRSERIRLVELPGAERGPVMRGFPTQVPRGVPFFLKTGAVDAPTPAAFEKGAAR